MKGRTQPDLRIATDAAAWMARLEEDDSQECREQFVAWLRQSPVHIEEFLLVSAAHRELDAADSHAQVSVDELMARASVGVVPLIDESRAESLSRERPSRKQWGWVRLTAAAASLAILAISGLIVWRANAHEYVTGLGEQRSVRLDDGSVIQLNTQSHIDVNYSDTAREVRLLEGEAMFVVEHDPARPFRVRTDTTVVQAIGTQFNVYRREGETTVSVVDGRVEVTTETPVPAQNQLSSGTASPERAPTDVSHQPTRLQVDKGEQVNVGDDGSVTKSVEADVTSTVAWRQRRLIFKSTPLADIVREFNRYNPVPIRIEDETLSRIQLTLVFDADDPESLLTFLQSDFDAAIDRQENEIIVRTHTAKASE